MASTKDQILADIQADEQAWASLAASIPADRLTEPGPMGEWSFRDLVSHLLSWRDRTIGRLEAAKAGAPRPANEWPAGMSDDDPINAWFLEQHAGRSADDLLGEYARSFARLSGAVAGVPADAFLAETEPSSGYVRWRDTNGEVESDFSGHLREHADDVRAWLAKG